MSHCQALHCQTTCGRERVSEDFSPLSFPMSLPLPLPLSLPLHLPLRFSLLPSFTCICPPLLHLLLRFDSPPPPHLMATLVHTTYSTCWENGLRKENAFMASHTHFCLLLRNRYWTVGMGVRRFMAEGGRGEGEREGGREGGREGRREEGRGRRSTSQVHVHVHMNTFTYMYMYVTVSTCCVCLCI